MKQNYPTNNRRNRVITTVILVLCLSYNGFSQVTQTFSTAGTFSFTPPAGVTNITVECWGGGGAGGGATGSTSCAGGGGAGGAYTKKTSHAVTSGTAYTVTVGGGGTASTGNGGAGGSSWFGSASTIMALGGPGGIGNTTNNSSANGGTAPTTGNAGGGTSFYGGNGAKNGTTGAAGGGGGGSAGTAVDGNDASAGTGGTAVTGGGAGASGSTTGANGAGGSAPGGGGAGARATSTTDRSGGAGGAGKVVITYTAGYKAQFTAMNIGSANWCAGETRTVTVTVTNVGQATWTNSGPDVNIGVKWNADADYFVRTDANNLAPGASQTYSLTVTAPATAGSNNLTFDVVKEADCWFGGNAGSCGPGNSVYTSAAITINTTPVDRTLTTSSVCTGGSTNVVVATSVAGINYQLRNNADNSNVGAAVAGTGGNINLPTGVLTNTTTYNILAVNATTGCTAQLSTIPVIAVNTMSGAPTSASASATTVCAGKPVTLTLNGGGGGTGEVVKWYADSCGGTIAATGNGAIVTPTFTTTYYGRYEDGAPCSFNTTCAGITINVNPLPAASISFNETSGGINNDGSICTGASVTLIANPTTGMSYSWAAPISASGNNQVQTPAVTTLYTVTVTNASTNCSNTATGTVTVATPANQTVTAPSGVFVGGSTNVTLGSSATGVTYQLRNNANNANIGSPVSGTGGSINLPTGAINSTTTFNVLALATTSGCTIQLSTTPTINAVTAGNGYYRSQATGNWGTASTWQTSADNATWATSTTVPNNNAIAITVSVGNTVTVAAAATASNLTIAGTLVMNTTAANTLSVSGNWIQNGTFTASTNTVIFNGPSAQTVSGTAATTFYNLTINTSATATTVTSTTKAFTVNNLLTLTRGNLVLQATDANYLFNGDVSVASAGILTHGVSWDTYSLAIVFSGNVTIDGIFNYTTRSLVQFFGVNKTVRTGTNPASAFCIVLIVNPSGATSASGQLVINDNFYPCFNSAGSSFNTNGQAITAKAGVFNFGGTLNINGGSLNVTGGLYAGYSLAGTVNLSSGALVTDALTVGDNTNIGTFNYTGGTLDVNGSLIIATSSKLICTGSPTINVAGNWTNLGGTFTPATSTVLFDGSGAQVINGPAAQTFYNIASTGTNVSVAASTTTLNVTNVTLTSGTFGAGTAADINVSGNWTNNGATYNSGLGRVTFNGTTLQTIGGSAATIFYNVTLNNTTGAALGVNTGIANQLTLTNGKITTGPNNALVMFSTATNSILGVSAAKYINGNLNKGIANGTGVSQIFEIGDASNYTPITLNFAGTVSGSGSITTATAPINEPAILSSTINETKNTVRFWYLGNNNVAGFTSYSATVTFVPTDIVGSANTSAFIMGLNTGTWAYPTIGTRTATTTAASGLTGFGTIIVGEGGAAVPTMATQPASQSVCAGGVANFTAVANSIPGSTVQWQINTGSGFTNLTIASPYSVNTSSTATATTSVLSINPATTAISTYQYRAVFTNSRGFVNSNVATLTVNPLPVASISTLENSGGTANDGTICTGASVTLTASPTSGMNYAWSSPSGVSTNNPVVNPATTTTYGVLVTNQATGCSATASATVTVPLPSASVTATETSGVATNDDIICAGASVVLTANPNTAGITYAWAAPISAANNVKTVNPSSNTNYVVTVTHTATGCSLIASKNITVNALPIPAISPNYCYGNGQVQLTSNSQNAYAWSTGESTQSILVDRAGTYFVTATTVAGCTAEAFTTVALELVTNGNFNSGATGFVTGYTNVQTANGLQPEGTYAVGVNANTHHTSFWGKDHTTGASNFMIINGSKAAVQPTVWQQTVTIQPNTVYYFSAWAMSVNAIGPNYAQLQFNVNGQSVGNIASLGAGPANATQANANTYWQRFYGTWNSGSSTSAVISIVDNQTAASGNDFALDDISCSTLSTVTLSSAASNSSTSVCQGNNISLSAGRAGGASPFTFAWSGPNSFTSSAENPVVANATPAKAGSYTVNITDAHGCSATGTAVIVVSTPSTVVAGTSPNVCQSGSPVAAALSGASFGGGASSAAWSIASGGGTLSSTAQTTNPSAVTYTPANNFSGTVTLTLTTNSQSGCPVATANRTIVVNPLPNNITPTATNAVCYNTNTNIQLAGSQSGISYQLRNNANNNAVGAAVFGNGTTINLPTGVLTTTTTFNVLATNTTTGCNVQMTPTVTIIVNPLPVVTASPVAAVCNGNAATIAVSNSSGTAGTISASNTTAVQGNGNDPQTVSTSITLPSGTLTSLSNITLTMNVAKVNCGDLTATLTSPCGSTTVFSGPGGLFNFNSLNGNYTFTNSSGSNFIAGFLQTIPSGTYKATFAGINTPCTNVAGTWTLTLSTPVIFGTGEVVKLNSWSISISGAAGYTSAATGPGTISPVTYSGANNANASFQVTPPLGSNNYTVTTTDAVGCTASVTVPVLVNPLPVATVSATETSGISTNDRITCANDQVSFVAGPATGMNYAWSAPIGGTGNNKTHNPVNTTAYTVTVSNATTGCSATASTTVTVNPNPTKYIVVGGACIPAIIKLSGSQTGLSYQLLRNGNINMGSAVIGTSDTLNFGAQTLDGIYSVVANNYTTGCSSNMIGVATTNFCTSTWIGVQDTSWVNPSNWNPAAVPNNCYVNVVVPNATPFAPAIPTEDINVKDINIYSGVTLKLAGHNLNVCGNWIGGTGTNAKVLGSGTVYINSSTNVVQSITGNTVFDALQIINSKGVVLSNNSSISIGRGLHLQLGNLNVSAGTLHLLSTAANNNSYIDDFSPGYSGTLTGTIIADRYIPVAGSNQHFISSPVNTPALTQIGAVGRDGGYVNPTTDCDETISAYLSPYGTVFTYNDGYRPSGFCMLGNWMVKVAGNMDNARGYSAYLNGNTTISLVGNANTGNMQVDKLNNSGYPTVNTLQGQPIESGWNLVGNPYPSSLDLTIDRTGEGFQNQVQVWKTSGAFAGSWQAEVINGNAGHVVIPPFQAFMVRVQPSSPGMHTYSFYQSERTRASALPFYRSISENRLELYVDYNGLRDVTKVEFNPSATTGFDDAYDANKTNGKPGRPTLYTTMSSANTWYAMNTQPSLTEATAIPVGLRPEANGAMTISALGLESFDPTTYIFLEDRKTNTWHNLRDGDYNFTTNTSDDQHRFVLHFTPPVHILTTDASCGAAGQVNIEQPGNAKWNYSLRDKENTVISSGVLNSSNVVSVSANAGSYTLSLTDNNGYNVVKNVTVGGAQVVTAAFNTNISTAQVQDNINFSSTTVDATNYIWDFGDGTTSAGVSASHTYQMEGVYTASLTVSSSGGCSSIATKAITITGRTITGISNITDDRLKIWSHGNIVYVDFSKQSKVEAEIELYNVLGQVISSEKFGRVSVYAKDIPNLQAAYVIVRVMNNGKLYTQKCLLKND